MVPLLGIDQNKREIPKVQQMSPPGSLHHGNL